MKRIVLHPQLYFLLPLIFLFPNGWILSWVIAAMVHECLHLISLNMFKTKILALEIGITGAKIVTEPMTPGKEFMTALAGPVGALFLLAFSGRCPKIAICALFQSFYNLLPIYPLDGGRALRCLVSRKIDPDQLHILEKYILYIIIFLILIIGSQFKQGIVSIIFCIGLLVQHRNANIPCKDGEHGVQ